MPILQAELKVYKSSAVNDTGTNGGAMSSNVVTSGAAQNVFPPVFNAERVAGGTKYRKVFQKVENDSELPLFNPRIFLENYTLAQDYVTFFPGTQSDTQASITGSERQYGCGQLNTNVSGGATQIIVDVEDDLAAGIFQNGDTIRISDKTDINDGTGNEEFVTISGAPGVVGSQVTIDFTPALSNAYLASETRVASVYEPATIESSVDNLVVTAAGSGDYDSAYLSADAIGSIEQVWTLTFTDATNFTISGSSVGSVGTGSVAGGASPNNTDFTKPYFVLQSAGFSGTFAAADTIVFQTHPAAAPLWMKRVVPAGSATAPTNSAVLAVQGETA